MKNNINIEQKTTNRPGYLADKVQSSNKYVKSKIRENIHSITRNNNSNNNQQVQ